MGASRGSGALRAAIVTGAAALVALSALGIADRAWRAGIERNRHERTVAEVSSALAGAAGAGTAAMEILGGVPPPSGGALEALDRRARLFRAISKGEVAAVALAFGIPDGYAGPVTLLIGVGAGLKITGVRVLEHSETPGIGDFIGDAADAWIGRFVGSAGPDTGVDAVAGATVTSSAVTRGVDAALRALAADRARVFAPPPRADAPGPAEGRPAAQ